MTPAERLAQICSTDPTRANITTPFGMDFKGARWLAATDGRTAVAILGDAEMRAGAPDLGQVLSTAPPPGFRADLALLREWAGPVPPPRPPPSVENVDCDECDGSGKVTCLECERDGAECQDCNGTGKVEEVDVVDAPPRYGAIFGGILNRVLLARVLVTLPDDTTYVRIGQAEPLAPYILRAKGWLAAIMPVTGEKSAERFTELEAVAA